MNTKGSILTNGVATGDNTDFGVLGWNKIQSYTEKKKIQNFLGYFLCFYLQILCFHLLIDSHARKLNQGIPVGESGASCNTFY